MIKILQEVIDKAYTEWRQGIVAGEIPTTNERTIQVYLAYHILQQSKQVEAIESYKFTVRLEENMGKIHTNKTQGNARCDIIVALDGKGKSVRAAIEMKRLETKANAKNAATTDARFAVLADLENLEHYNADLKYEVAYADYAVFPHSQDDVKFNISNGENTDKRYEYKKKNRTNVVELIGKYVFAWDDLPYGNPKHYFLKLRLK